MEIPDQNIAVFTTSHVVKMKLPIVYVSHDADGDWQFLSSDGAAVEEAMLVSLREILQLDLSIKKILQMPLGTEAHRVSTADDWIVVGKS